MAQSIRFKMNLSFTASPASLSARKSLQ